MCCFDLSVLQRTTKFLQRQDKTSVHDTFLKLFAQNFCSLTAVVVLVYLASAREIKQAKVLPGSNFSLFLFLVIPKLNILFSIISVSCMFGFWLKNQVGQSPPTFPFTNCRNFLSSFYQQDGAYLSLIFTNSSKQDSAYLSLHTATSKAGKSVENFCTFDKT